MNQNLSLEDVYIEFRKAQSSSKNRPYRLPKDFDSFLENRMSKKNAENLKLITGYFNTKWKEVDPFEYFLCGFELFKTFSYAQFFKKNVLALYIQRDKAKKRSLENIKREINESYSFFKRYIDKHDMNVYSYCDEVTGNRKLPVVHYLENKIGTGFISILIASKWLRINDDEMAAMPYVVGRWFELLDIMEENKDFIDKVKTRILRGDSVDSKT